MAKLALSMCVALATATAVQADSAGTTAMPSKVRYNSPSNPFGFYVGGDIGYSHVQTSAPSAGSPDYLIDKSVTGWTAFVGVRPVKHYGAELSYIDFGKAHLSGFGDLTHADAHNTALGVFVLRYLPIPTSRWDVFGKIGLVDLKMQGDSTGNYPNTCVVNPVTQTCDPVGVASASRTHHESDFAYGVGTQLRFGAWGVRAEYQRASATGNDPNLFSFGLIWKF